MGGGRTAVNDGGFSAIAGEIGEKPNGEKQKQATEGKQKSVDENQKNDKSGAKTLKQTTEGENSNAQTGEAAATKKPAKKESALEEEDKPAPAPAPKASEEKKEAEKTKKKDSDKKKEGKDKNAQTTSGTQQKSGEDKK